MWSQLAASVLKRPLKELCYYHKSQCVALSLGVPQTYGQLSHQTHPDLISSDEVTPYIAKAEYSNRRKLLANLIRKNDFNKRHIVVLPSLDRSYMAAGVPFIYRQHSNLSYLSGFLEPDSVLVLDINSREHSSCLFVKQQTAHEDLWEGRRSGIKGSVELTGVDRADSLLNLKAFLSDALKDGAFLWYDAASPVSRIIHDSEVKSLLEVHPPTLLRCANRDIQSLRVIKSPAEQELMRISGSITAEMFTESMRFAVHNPHEHLIFAKFDFECRTRGATNLAYLPVVAGGENATTIHYIRNDCPIGDDQLVLVDAGSDYYGYVTDVTRTWPVSGKFSEIHKQLYEAVQEVFEICTEFIRPTEFSLNDIHSVMVAAVAQQLVRLGIVKSTVSEVELARIAQDVCPHHVGHYLGLDVHDTPLISRSRKLEPGMAICIEPGLYFAKDCELVHKELRGIGVRIEDDFLITETGHENITSACPNTWQEIEALLVQTESK